MGLPHVKYLLVGGGVASRAAAAAIRTLDPIGSIFLLSQEVTRPYRRTVLSKAFLRDEIGRDALLLDPIDWYTHQNIELHTGQRLSAIDVPRRSAVLDNGLELNFDKLLIATGASPIGLEVPGANLPGIYTLRSIEDAERLRKSVEKARAEGRPHPAGAAPRGRGRATIIGGGLLGVELAASLRQLGLAIDWIVATETPWDSLVGEATGRFIVRCLEHHGVTVHTAATPLRLEGDGRVQQVVISTGLTVPADLVVAAIGVAVNRQILRGTSIRAEKAILTDESCRTNVPDIFAAGDCAAVFDPSLRKHRTGQHWNHAEITGTIAGTNMAGGHATFDAVPTFDSELFGVRILGAGEPRRVDRRIVRGLHNVASPDLTEIGVAADGTIAQIIAVGGSTVLSTMEAIIRRKLNVMGIEEQVKDPANDLNSFLA